MVSSAVPMGRVAPHARTRPAVAAPRLEVLSRRGDAAGVRPPLLLVHGAWHGAWCWDRGFMDRLAGRGFDVHAVSLRGHGGSEGGERLRWTRIRDYVDDVARVAAGLRQEPVLVGHSMGGYVVHKYLEGRRSPGAALLAPVPHYGVAPTFLRLLRMSPMAVVRCNTTLSLRHMIACPDRARRLFFSGPCRQRRRRATRPSWGTRRSWDTWT